MLILSHFTRFVSTSTNYTTIESPRKETILLFEDIFSNCFSANSSPYSEIRSSSLDTLSISVSICFGITDVYKSIVICRDECPRYACTVFGAIPASKQRVANVWRKQCAEKKIENLRKALDKLNEELPEDVKIKASTIPMCIYGMYRMVRDSKSTSKYMEWLNKFLASYDTNLDYLQYCSNGTSNSDMVNGRLQFFKDAIKEIG